MRVVCVCFIEYAVRERANACVCNYANRAVTHLTLCLIAASAPRDVVVSIRVNEPVHILHSSRTMRLFNSADWQLANRWHTHECGDCDWK